MSASVTYSRKEPGPFLHKMRLDRIALDLAGTYLLGKGIASDVPGGITAFLKSELAGKLPDIQLLFARHRCGPRPICNRSESRSSMLLRAGSSCCGRKAAARSS